MKSELNLKEISDLQKVRHETVTDWINKFKSDSLTYLHFLSHWAFWVPKAFSQEREFNACEAVVNEDVLDTVLIKTIEGFIFNDSEELQKSFHDICKHKSVCGNIFKGGDPFYSCRDCGTDSTCVLCASCFMVSVHKNHNYKIGTSAGGGCCDCGDVLSWKNDPHCAEHLRGIQNGCSITFTEDLISRTKLVASAILQYCFEILMLKPSSSPSLPTIFKSRDDEDILGSNVEKFCVVLYNDESHSFEQVASILTSVTSCSSIEAYSLATYIDKEGRAILKHSTYPKCTELKLNLFAFTSLHNILPLKVQIIDWQLVTHQIYSCKLLSWLENFIKQIKEFRDLVTLLSLNLGIHRKGTSLMLGSQKSLVEEILLHDSILWKSARVRWYHLFLSVMLVDHSNRIAFARVFTSNYGAIVKNFILDDHEHVFSVASLSVQIFTVPLIAHYLIGCEDAMSIMLSTFYSECTKVCNADGKLDFTHANLQTHFFRSFCVLHDLRYLLSSPPAEWTSDLRRNFIQGISILLDIFLLMQDMCANKRQIGQHLEFESEWKQEFKLQIKLTPVISHVLNWCSTDQIVAIKSYRLILKKLFNYYSPNLIDEACSIVSLAGHALRSYNFTASSESISLHLPLSRFLAGLFLHLHKFGFDFNSPEFNALIKPTPFQIIEPVLRTQVMIAQVHAGMWKRNGHSLPNQIICYQSPKCRTEMLDKDIISLQIGASLIESNEFLLNLLHKFHLTDWANSDFEFLDDDSLKQVILLSEEFLSLLITVVGERYHPGIGKVTAEECLQYEIIHRLFIKPSLHSELYSFLPDSDCFKTEIENIIDKVATFQKPNNSQKGVYVVKEEFTDRYNAFFYHYTKEERSRSEEQQGKTHTTEFRLPPSLPELNPSFQAVACLLHSHVLLHIIRLVLIRSQSLSEMSFSENQLYRVLFLIGFALQKDECYCKVKFTSEANEWDVKFLLEKLVDCKHIQPYKSLILCLLEKFRVFMKDSEGCKNDEDPKDPWETSLCIGREMEVDRCKLIAERQAAIMAQMSALQQNFITNNAKVFQNLHQEERDSLFAHKGKGNLAGITYHDKTLTCILCQDHQYLSRKGLPMVCAAFIQKTEEVAKMYSLLSLDIGKPVHVNTCGHFMHAKCWKEYIETMYFEETRRPFRLRQLLAYDVGKNEYLCPLCKCLSNTILPILPRYTYYSSHIPFSEWLQHLVTSTFDSPQLKEPSFTEFYETNILTMDANTDIITNETGSESKSKPSACPLNKRPSEVLSRDSHSGSGTDLPSTTEDKQMLEAVNFSKKTMIIIDLFTTSLNVVSEISSTKKENMHLVLHSCAHTIRSLEKYLQFSEKPLLGGFSYRQETCLRNLINLSATLCVLNSEPKKLKISQQIFSNLLKSQNTSCPIVLQWDCLDLVISLILTSPYALNFKFDNNVYRFSLLLHIAQNILQKDMNNVIYLEDGDVTCNDTKCLAEIARLFKNCRGVNTVQLWCLLKTLSLPFLRCCAIWHYFLTGSEPPEVLKEVGGETFENILDFLGIPSSCEELLDCSLIGDIFRKWELDPGVQEIKNSWEENFSPSIGIRNKLVELPHDYCELINCVSLFSCPNSHREDTRNPTMCLVCGILLCGDVYCCQKELNKVLVGSCSYHAHHCSAGSGIFLRIRECQIFLLSSSPSRGCFMAAPYFDEYGEADQGLFRGNPLYLSKEKYNDLQKLWLSHGIQEEISRAIESSHVFSMTQWSLL